MLRPHHAPETKSRQISTCLYKVQACRHANADSKRSVSIGRVDRQLLIDLVGLRPNHSLS